MRFPSRPLLRSPALSALLAALSLTLLGWGLLSLLQRQRDDRELLVAITSWPAYEYLYLAEQQQLGRPHGLRLRIKQYSSLADQRAAYVRGDLGVMATTLPEAIAICQEAPQRCPLLILVLDESRGADRLLARLPIRRPEQLLGQRVGLERTVLAEYLLLRSFGDRPVQLDRQLQLVFDGPVALVKALQGGELDAIVSYDPHAVPLLSDPAVVELFSTRQLPGEVVDVLAVDPALAAERAPALQALVRTWWEARAYARRHPHQALAVMAQREQVEPKVFEQSERGLHYPARSQQPELLAASGPVARTVAAMARLMQRAGRIQPDRPLPQPTTAFLASP